MPHDVTFGLVHGSGHRAACWNPLVAELSRRGFQSVAVDLPCDRADAGVDDYAEVVAGALREVDGSLVLVGHSLGGLTIPVVATRRPVALLVYLCAVLPDPGRSLAQQLGDDRPAVLTAVPRQTVLPDGRTQWPPEVARELFYHDCPPEEAARAAELLRPQGRVPLGERTPLAAWPHVPAEYILCREDRMVSPVWSRQAARQRLGVTARELDGGHSPFLAQPAVLAGELLSTTQAHALGTPP
jgi:pimeloyl-ACP methyl ester carboxylesterase